MLSQGPPRAPTASVDRRDDDASGGEDEVRVPLENRMTILNVLKHEIEAKQ
jgi:hypothetical protein